MSIAKYPQAYCTLNSVIQQMNLDASTNIALSGAQTTIVNALTANDKAYLKRLIAGTSDIISSNMQRAFMPYTMSYKIRPDYYNRNAVKRGQEMFITMPDDLLSIDSIDWNGTALIADTDYRLADESISPNHEIAVDYADATMLSQFDDYVTIVGKWGYHRNPTTMFSLTAGTVASNPLTSSSTSLVVSNSALFEVYQLIRIESEYLFITDITTAGHILTVERGSMGTTASAHIATTPIYTYNNVPQVEQVVRRMVVKLFNKRGEVGDILVIGEGAYQIANEKFDLKLNRVGFKVV